jgi:hypothetical protein
VRAVGQEGKGSGGFVVEKSVVQAERSETGLKREGKEEGLNEGRFFNT